MTSRTVQKTDEAKTPEPSRLQGAEERLAAAESRRGELQGELDALVAARGENPNRVDMAAPPRQIHRDSREAQLKRDLAAATDRALQAEVEVRSLRTLEKVPSMPSAAAAELLAAADAEIDRLAKEALAVERGLGDAARAGDGDAMVKLRARQQEFPALTFSATAQQLRARAICARAAEEEALAARPDLQASIEEATAAETEAREALLRVQGRRSLLQQHDRQLIETARLSRKAVQRWVAALDRHAGGGVATGRTYDQRTW